MEVRELLARVTRQLSAGNTGEIALSPKSEERYRELVRDYEVMEAAVREMRSRRATAELKAEATSTSAAESYVLIDPPREPEYGRAGSGGADFPRHPLDRRRHWHCIHVEHRRTRTIRGSSASAALAAGSRSRTCQSW